MLPATTYVSKLKKLEDMKKVIRSLLISMGTRDITLPKLNNAYKDMEDEDIPFREFNFTSLKDFLSSMPDVLELSYNKDDRLCVYHIDTEKSQHVSSLVRRQKKEPESKKSKSVRRHNFIDPRLLNRVLQELKSSSTYRNNRKSIYKVDVLLKITNQIGDHAFYTVHDLNNQLNELTHVLTHDDDYIYFKDRISKNNQYRKKDEKIVKQKKDTSTNLNYVDNFNNINDKTENLTESEPIDDLVRDSTKERLRKLVKKHPEGIWCFELPDVYRREYGLDLEYSDLGFNSIIEFVAALPKIFKIILPPNTRKQKVIDATTYEQYLQNLHTLNSICAQSSENAEKEQEAIPTNLSPQVAKTLIPKDSMGFDDTVEQINATSLSKKLDIIISEVINPSFFWAVLRKNGSKLTKMMSSLDEFYRQQDLHNFRIPKIVLQPGLHIATTYCDVWHRGIIKEIKSNKLVVLFYDYGTEEMCDSNKLYFLNKRFSVLPAQAIPCSLYNVKPIRKVWSSEITKGFTNLVFERPFVANIHKIDEKANVMFVDLINVSNDECINDFMVKKKVAEPGITVCKINNFTYEYKLLNTHKSREHADKSKVHIVTNNRTVSKNQVSRNFCDERNILRSNYISVEKKLEVVNKYKMRLSSTSESSSSMSSPSKNSIDEGRNSEDEKLLNRLVDSLSNDLDQNNGSSDPSLRQKNNSLEDFSNSSFSSLSISSSYTESADEGRTSNLMFKC